MGFSRFFVLRHSILVIRHQEIESNFCFGYRGVISKITLVQFVNSLYIYTGANRRDY